jgi:hypothetical protein
MPSSCMQAFTRSSIRSGSLIVCCTMSVASLAVRDFFGTLESWGVRRPARQAALMGLCVLEVLGTTRRCKGTNSSWSLRLVAKLVHSPPVREGDAGENQGAGSTRVLYFKKQRRRSITQSSSWMIRLFWPGRIVSPGREVRAFWSRFEWASDP